jgi:hypothetical protein
MNRANLRTMNVKELVERFAAIAVEQNNAMMEGAYGDHVKYNRLIRQMRAVEQELEKRPGDQRRALVDLYNHDNMQARLMAAKLTLAVAPEAARQMLQRIYGWGRQPQAGDAGMCLWNLDRGVFVPK